MFYSVYYWDSFLFIWEFSGFAMQKVLGLHPRRVAWIWVYYSCGSAASFGWDVKPRSSLCSTPNMDYKDPDITEEENL